MKTITLTWGQTDHVAIWVDCDCPKFIRHLADVPPILQTAIFQD